MLSRSVVARAGLSKDEVASLQYALMRLSCKSESPWCVQAASRNRRGMRRVTLYRVHR